MNLWDRTAINILGHLACYLSFHLEWYNKYKITTSKINYHFCEEGELINLASKPNSSEYCSRAFLFGN